MERRDINFFYLSDFQTSDYRKKIIDYLKEKEKIVEDMGFPEIIVDFHSLSLIENPKPTGQLLLYPINHRDSDSKKVKEICGYVLSKDRKYVPLDVICSQKEDFGMIEEILKDNYGDKGRLTYGPIGMGWLFNIKRIKTGRKR